MFRWIVEEGGLESSPMARIPAPVDRPDQVEPFTSEQIEALLGAARKSLNAKRDEAVVLFLLDTGARASELCDMVLEDVDVAAKSARIRDGKGGKDRTVYLGRTSVKALWSYLKEDSRRPGDPIFSNRDGGPMNRTSLLKLIMRLGKEAGISNARCSPHTFRHTCALSFLRSGGSQFALMSLLGHTDLKMTARYVHLAQADVERQHRQFSPADNIK
jgi:integrase/recombinase XerD